MGGLIGGGENGSVGSSAPIVHHIKVNSATYGSAIPIVYGRARMPTLLMWTGDFHATQSKAQGSGKGGTGAAAGSGTVTYSVSVVEGLCAGPIPALGRTWMQTSKGTRREPLASKRWTIFLGAIGQTPWSYITTKHPGQDLGYSGIAYVALANWQLGTASVPPPRTFEVFGLLSSATGSDVNGADIISDYFSDTNYGLGLSAALLGNVTTTFKQYCKAAGYNFSVVLDSQKKGVEWLQYLMQMCNAQAVWSEGTLDLIPLIDNSSLALNGDNGSTFDATVFLTPIYTLTDDDFVTSATIGSPIVNITSPDDNDPVSVNVMSPADRQNALTVEYTDVMNDYNLSTVEAKDEADIAQFGLRPASALQFHGITTAQLARTVAQIQLQRGLNVPNQYRFRLRQNYLLADPMDVVNLFELGVGLNNYPVRILEIAEETDDAGNIADTLVFTAEDLGPNYSPGFGHQPPGPWGSEDPNRVPLPVNPPIIFEPPAKMLRNSYDNEQLHGALEVWILASGNEGQDAGSWQGANVYMSLDGTTYEPIGTIRSPATMGTLLSTLPTHADPDTTSTLAVDLSESNGIVESVTHNLADRKQSLAFVDTELISFADVTAGANPSQFNLKYLRRGLYTSSPGAHLAGTYFGFLGAIHNIDPAILRVPITADMVGQQLWFKLTSVNSANDGESDLADAVAYTITPAGAGALPVPGATDPLGFVNPVTNSGGWFDVQNQITVPIGLAELILSDTIFVGGFGIQYDWFSNGQLSIFVDNGTAGGSGENGYLFRLSPVSGVQPARIFRVDNGAVTDIGTYAGAVNASTLTAKWRHAAFSFRADGTMEFALDGVVRATATDTTYAANGPVGYGYEGASVTQIRHPTFTTDSGNVSSILPAPTALSATVTKKSDVRLAWAFASPKPHDFLHFEIRTGGGSFAAGTFLDTTKQLQYVVTDPAIGSTTYWVAAIDKNLGNTPCVTSASATIAAPGSVTALADSITAKGDVLLTWTKPGSFPTGFQHYEIRAGATFAASVLIDTTKQNRYIVVDPPVGTTLYWVAVIDLLGRSDTPTISTSAVIAAPGSVTGLTAGITKRGDVNLKWTKPASFPTGFQHYEIRTGATFAGSTLLDTTKQVHYLALDPAVGSITYWIAVIDLNGHSDTPTVPVTATVPGPNSVTGLASAVTKKADVNLTWTKPSSFPTGFAHYEIRSGSTFAGSTLVDTTKQVHYLALDPPVGATTYWIAVIDLNGNSDTPTISTTATIASPGSVTSLADSITAKGDVLLTWTKPASFPTGFQHYEIRAGATFGASVLIDTTKQVHFVVIDPPVGTTLYWVAVIDLLGHSDTPTISTSATIASPGSVSSLAAAVTKKNDVNLTWVKPASFPTGFQHYEIRSGSTFGTSTLLDTTKQVHYVVVDPPVGSTTYWIAVIDLLGHSDTPTVSVNAVVSAPNSVTSLLATVTSKLDIKLTWTPPGTLPNGFANYEIRQGATWAGGTLVGRTKRSDFLITDPPLGSTTYFVGVQDLVGHYDVTQPSVTGSVSTGFTSGAGLGGLVFVSPVVNPLGWIDVVNNLSTPYTLAQMILTDTKYTGTATVNFDWYSNGVFRLFFDSGTAGGSGENGYMFALDERISQQKAGIYRIDNGAQTLIGTYAGPVNASALMAAWHHISVTWFLGGAFQIVIDGVVWGTATDTTYTFNGPIGYGKSAVDGPTQLRNPVLTTDQVNPTLADPTSLTAIQTKKGDVQLAWGFTSPRPKGFSHFEIRTGSSFAAGAFLDTTKNLNYLIVDPPIGSAIQYWVAAVSTADQYDATPPHASITVAAPGSVTSLANAITKKGDVNLTWTRPGSFPGGFAHYEIRTGSTFAGSTLLDTTKQTHYLAIDPPVGATQYWIAVIDLLGHTDTPTISTTATVASPISVTSLANSITKKGDVNLTWTKPTSFPTGFAHYEIRTGSTFAGSTLLDTTKQNHYVAVDPAVGATQYWVAVIDLNGHTDTPTISTTATVAAPGSVTSLADSITTKGDVLLTWTKPGSFPTGFQHYEIRAGSTFALSTLIDTTKQTRYVVIDPPVGTTLYWIAVIDLLGHSDTPTISTSAVIAAPGSVTSLANTVTKKSDVNLTWTKPGSFPNGFQHYEIRTGATFAGSTLLDTTKQTHYLVLDPPVGGPTVYWVAVIDLLGHSDTPTISTSATIASPGSVSALAAAVTKKGDVNLTWTKPASFPTGFQHYEIRTGATFAGSTLIDTTKQVHYLALDPGIGTIRYWIAVIDLLGHSDTPTVPVDAVVGGPGNPSTFTVTPTKKADFIFTWAPASTLPTGFAHYEIRFGGGSFGAATYLAQTKNTRLVITDPPSGATVFWIATMDLLGNYSSGITATGTLTAFAAPTALTATVTSKKDVLLTWAFTEPSHFKIYEIRKAATNVGFAGAAVYHRTKQKQFLDTDPGTSTIWYYIAAYDDSENVGTPTAGVSGTVANGFSASTVNTVMTTVTGPLNLIGGAANRVSSHVYEVGDVYFAGAANMYAQCVIRGTSGTVAPTFHSPGVTYLDGGTCTFESLGSTVTGYGTFLAIGSVSLTVLDPADMVEVVLRMNYAISNLATGDQLQVQLKVDGSSNEIPLTTTDVSSGSSGQGTSAVFQKTLSGLSAGSHTFQFLAALTNASGGGTLGMAIDSALLWAKDYNT